MRTITKSILSDLKKKMVFIGGPRQVGKTTLAQYLLEKKYPSGRYFNWDWDEDRRDIMAKRWSDGENLLVFDELHKYPRWKSWVKGLFDVEGDKHHILVTGSARLDAYRRGGDSLLGRYHYWRLHPFSLDEIPKGISPEQALERLMTVGGFPEPFLDNDERSARRWRRDRYDRVLREDVRDLENLRHIQLLRLFVDLLRQRVGSPVVLSHLAADLEISPKTAKAWLEVLERMYLIFTVKPLTAKISRAIRKPPKVFFYDTGDVLGEQGARFENLVAAGLLKRLHFLEDRDGYRYELRYIRDKEGREVDFAILKEGKLQQIIEVKYSEEKPSKSLLYYAERISPPSACQIVATTKRSFNKGKLLVTDPISYFKTNNWW